MLESCTLRLWHAFATTRLLGRSGGGGNPARGTEVSPPARILCFFMETFLYETLWKHSRPALLWLLGKAAQVCLHLVLTSFSLGGGVSPLPENWVSWLGQCPCRKGVTFVPAGCFCPRTEEGQQLSARLPWSRYLPGEVRALSFPAVCWGGELLPVCLLPSTHWGRSLD